MNVHFDERFTVAILFNLGSLAPSHPILLCCVVSVRVCIYICIFFYVNENSLFYQIYFCTEISNVNL